MKNFKISLLFIFAIFSFASCVKDNSNVNFNEMNKIEIEGLEDTYEVTLGEKLTINPKVNFTDDDLSYVWYTYSAIGNSKRDTLSTERVLDRVISGSNATPGIDYKLVFRVIDNKTGVFESKEMNFVANSLYTKGLLMLCEKEGEIELNMLMPNNSVLSNLYSLNNDGEMLNRNYREISFSNPNDIKPEMKQVFLFANQADGGAILDPVTLTKQHSAREMFGDPIDAVELSISGYSGKFGMIDYIFLNGKLCKRAVNMGVTLFESNPLVVSNSATDFNIGGFISFEGQPIVYDDMNGRILAHAPWNKGTLIRVNPNMSSSVPFDGDNMGNYAFLSAGRISNLNYWMLMKDRGTNELVLFKFILEKKQSGRDIALALTPLSKIVITPAIAPNMSKDSYFIKNNNMLNTGFYVSGNKLYSLNIGAVTSSSTLAEVELVAPVNMTITGYKYVSVKVADPTPDNPNKTRDANQIRLMVQDNNLSTLKGGVVYYEISTVGGITATEVYRKVGGFCDKLIDIEEKNS